MISGSQNAPSPNIILIVADSLRYDHVGHRQNGGSLTPGLERLAEQALIFTNAIAQGPSTRVSMNALMSSTYASMYGGEQKLSPRRPVIQQMLKEAGYRTAAISANLYLSRSFGWERGFDWFDDCRPEGAYRQMFWRRVLNKGLKRLGKPLIWPRSLPGEMLFSKARQVIGRIGQPYFLWVHLMDTHWPYSIQKFSWSSEWRKQRMSDNEIMPRLISDPPRLSTSEVEMVASLYQNSVRYTDEQISSFISWLDRTDQRRNTWVVITADHGEEFQEHGRFFHGPTPFQELAHVPLWVLPPSNSPYLKGSTCDSLVRLIDLAPTFLDLAQVSQPDEINLYGKSLAPLIEGTKNTITDYAITESPFGQALAIKTNRWKYIWEIQKERRMLFDLQKDPHEQQNLVSPEVFQAGSQAAVQAEDLHATLEQHLELVRQNASPADGEEEIEMDPELLARLRELGYVE